MSSYFYKDNLQSARLTTRFLTEVDIAAWAEFFEYEDGDKYIPYFGNGSALEKSKAMIDFQLNRYREHTYGLQVLVEKSTGNFIGLCGLLYQAAYDAEIEVGYHILHKHWGQGFAPEAAQLFIDYAFENNITESIIAIIDINNKNSQRVAEKLGFVNEKRVELEENHPEFVYRLKKSESIK
jgi:[ribosomal protein S5]-alanine N-acetyltransferase